MSNLVIRPTLHLPPTDKKNIPEKTLNYHFSISFPEFPTHVQISAKRKVKGKLIDNPRYEKISGEKFYSGVLNKYTRAKIISFMKGYIIQNLSRIPEIRAEFKKIKTPVLIRLTVHVVGAYQSIRLKSDNTYMIYNSDKGRHWDIQNLGWIWSKVFDDCLVSQNLLVDDSIDYVIESGGAQFVEEPDFNKRKLVFHIFSK